MSHPYPTFDLNIGKIKKIIHEETHIEWKIDDFFSVYEEGNVFSYVSPSFSFSNALWHLKLWPRWVHGSIRLFLFCEEKRDFLVEYKFALKKKDGNIERSVNGFLVGEQESSDACDLITISELLLKESERVPSDVLTITCTLRHEIDQATAELYETKQLQLIRLDKLSDNFKDLFADKEGCDVILKVKNKEFKAHRPVLMARSNVFAANFKHDTVERQTGIITITDCNPDSFPQFLEYLYCGKLDNISFHSALDLYYTSGKYDVQELKTFCVEYLMQCLTVENMCEAVVFADKYDELPLLSAVQEFLNRNVRQVLETIEWEQLRKNHTRLANNLLKGMFKV